MRCYGHHTFDVPLPPPAESVLLRETDRPDSMEESAGSAPDSDVCAFVLCGTANVRTYCTSTDLTQSTVMQGSAKTGASSNPAYRPSHVFCTDFHRVV